MRKVITILLVVGFIEWAVLVALAGLTVGLLFALGGLLSVSWISYVLYKVRHLLK